VNDLHGLATLVTGGAGFIGSHLAEELVARGARVTVLDDLSTGDLHNLDAVMHRIEFLKLDLCRDDLESLFEERGFAVVFHLAANADVGRSVNDPRRDFEANIGATLRLLEALRAVSPNTILLNASSAAVYGEGTGVPLLERHPTFPIAPYGISKLAAEHYVGLFARLYGLRTASLRLFSSYGPRLTKQVVYDLMCKIAQNPNELSLRGDGTQERDFNHVSNVVEAFLLTLEKAPLSGEIYNVAGEETVSIRRLTEMICEGMGVSPRFVFSGQVRPGEVHRWKADITSLRGLGYHPRLKLEDGLAATIAWFRGWRSREI
jgi:UDP-glucose 4-epimerase